MGSFRDWLNKSDAESDPDPYIRAQHAAWVRRIEAQERAEARRREEEKRNVKWWDIFG